METGSHSSGSGVRRETLFRGVVGLLAVGLGLGLAYNAMGQRSDPAWGLDWIGRDRLAALPTVSAAEHNGMPASGSFTTDVSDPMAIGGSRAASAGVPQVADLDRPQQVQLAAVKQFFDADAAVFVDAREPEEFAAGHIEGAVSVPFDLAMSEPERLEAIDSGGRPLIVYCGGGACELSVSLAWELIFVGHTKVLVYMGGYPEWEAAAYPTRATAGGRG